MGYAYGSSIGLKKVIERSIAALKNFNKCENDFENKTWKNYSSAHLNLTFNCSPLHRSLNLCWAEEWIALFIL